MHHVASLNYIRPMTTSSTPSLSVERQHVQSEFIARGLRSRDEARRTNAYVDADVVLEELQRKLDSARATRAKARK